MNRFSPPVSRPLAACVLLAALGSTYAQPLPAQTRSIVIDDLTITDFEKSRASQKPESFHITGPHTRLRAVDPESHAIIQVQSPDISGSSSGGKEAAIIVFKGPVTFQTEQKDTATGGIQRANGKAGRAIYRRKEGILELLDRVSVSASDSVKQPIPCSMIAASATVLIAHNSSELRVSGGPSASVIFRQGVPTQSSDEGQPDRVTTLSHFDTAVLVPGRKLEVSAPFQSRLELKSSSIADKRQTSMLAPALHGKFAPDGSGLAEVSAEGQITANSEQVANGKTIESLRCTANGVRFEITEGRLHLNTNPVITVHRTPPGPNSIPVVYRLNAGNADVDLHGEQAQVVTSGAASSNRFVVANLPNGKGSLQVANYRKLEYGASQGSALVFTGAGSRIEYADNRAATLVSASDEIRCYFDPASHDLRQVQQRGNVHTRYSAVSNNKYKIPRFVTADGEYLQADIYPDSQKQSQVALHITGFACAIAAPDILNRSASLKGTTLDIKQSSGETAFAVTAEPTNSLADLPTGTAPELAKKLGIEVSRRDLKLTHFRQLTVVLGKFAKATGETLNLEIKQPDEGKAATLNANEISCALSDTTSSVQAIHATGYVHINAAWKKPDNRLETLFAKTDAAKLDIDAQHAELTGSAYAAITDSKTLDGKAEISAGRIRIDYAGAFASASAISEGSDIPTSYAIVPAGVLPSLMANQKSNRPPARAGTTLYGIRQFGVLKFNAEQGGSASGPMVQLSAVNKVRGTQAEIISPQVSFQLAGSPALIQTADASGPVKYRLSFPGTEADGPNLPDTTLFGSANSLHLNAEMDWAELTGAVNAELNRSGNVEIHARVNCDRLAVTRDISVSIIASGRPEKSRLSVLRASGKEQPDSIILEQFEQAIVGGENTFKAVGAAVKANATQPRYNRTVVIAAQSVDGIAGPTESDFRIHAAQNVEFTLTEQDSGAGQPSPVSVHGVASEMTFTSQKVSNVEMLGPIELTLTDELRLLEPAHVLAPDEQKLTATLSKGVAGLEFTAGKSPVQISMTPRRAKQSTGSDTPPKPGK